jgi:cytochrome c-type biogenesis protein CcmH/NrfF
MLQAEKSNEQIVDFMLDRYGDFVNKCYRSHWQ